jgi:hypothetical protein
MLPTASRWGRGLRGRPPASIGRNVEAHRGRQAGLVAVVDQKSRAHNSRQAGAEHGTLVGIDLSMGAQYSPSQAGVELGTPVGIDRSTSADHRCWAGSCVGRPGPQNLKATG